MRCCVGPQNPSVANDISEQALTVVICFSFSTCCCPSKTSDTATLLAHPKLPVVARIWHVYTYSCVHESCQAISISRANECSINSTSGLSKIGGSYTLFLLPVLLCALDLVYIHTQSVASLLVYIFDNVMYSNLV